MPLLADLLICLRFFSRLPVPETARERNLGASGFAAAAAMAPLAGFVVAAPAALVIAGAPLAGLPPLVASISALAVLTAVTGVLHEDALADCADGFGGGGTRERKLEIMRDSAVGAYGSTAIGVSLLLRAAALAAAIPHQRASVAILVAAMLSRAACLLPLAILAPARTDGVGAAVRLGARPVVWACCLGAALAVALSAWTGATAALLSGFAALSSYGAALAVTALARRQIGGQTGDVAGLAQQAAEIAALLVFAAGTA